MARMALDELFPAFTPMISGLRGEGLDDSNILKGILGVIRELEGRGFSKEEPMIFRMSTSLFSGL